MAAIDFPVLFSDFFFRLFFTAVTEDSFVVVILNLRMKLRCCRAHCVLVSDFWLVTIFREQAEPDISNDIYNYDCLTHQAHCNIEPFVFRSSVFSFSPFLNIPEPSISVTNLWWAFRLVVSRLSMNYIRYNVNPLARPKFFSFVVAELHFYVGRRRCTRQGFFSRLNVTTKKFAV